MISALLAFREMYMHVCVFPEVGAGLTVFATAGTTVCDSEKVVFWKHESKSESVCACEWKNVFPMFCAVT